VSSILPKRTLEPSGSVPSLAQRNPGPGTHDIADVDGGYGFVWVVPGLEWAGECIWGKGEVATAGLGQPPLEEDDTMPVLPWLDTLMTDSRWLLEVTEYLLDRCERLAVRRSSCSAQEFKLSRSGLSIEVFRVQHRSASSL